MSYCIRVLAPVDDAPSAGEVARALQEEQFCASVAGSPSDADWERLTVQLPGQPPIEVERSIRVGEENPVDREVDGFLDELVECEETPGVQQVEAALRSARQLLVVAVPESFAWGSERTVVDALVEILSEPPGTVIQADGEGFYDREGNLLVPME